MGRPRKNPLGFKPEWRAWHSMKSRCSASPRANGHRYYGRGIRVCDAWWKSFPQFLADMGRKPSKKHQLERVDNDHGYEPGNVIWALPKRNHRNKSSNRHVTLLGRTQLLIEWAEEIGISVCALRYRINAGWTDDAIVHQPKRPWPGPRK